MECIDVDNMYICVSGIDCYVEEVCGWGVMISFALHKICPVRHKQQICAQMPHGVNEYMLIYPPLTT